MRTFIASLLLLASAATLSAADKIKVLIVDGQNNHKWDITTPVLKHALESSGAFTVDVSTSPPKGSPAEAWHAFKPDFTAYKAVVSNYNGEPWPQNVRDAFTKYVGSGGGFVSVHAANNSFPDWKEYNDMIGVGGWAELRARAALGDRVQIGRILHPSPASPAANSGWAEAAVAELRALGIEVPDPKVRSAAATGAPSATARCSLIAELRRDSVSAVSSVGEAAGLVNSRRST